MTDMIEHESHKLTNQTNEKVEFISVIGFIRDIRGKV